MQYINKKDNIMREGPVRIAEFENEDDNHFLTSIDTPIRSDAFAIDDELKIELIEKSLKKLWKCLD